MFFEFYYKFNLNAKRYDIHKKCAGKSGCTCLKIHALLVVMEIKAKYDSVAMTEHSKEIDDLLTESTDIRRIDTRKHHSCHGIHYPLDVVMAYNNAKRSLGIPSSPGVSVAKSSKQWSINLTDICIRAS